MEKYGNYRHKIDINRSKALVIKALDTIRVPFSKDPEHKLSTNDSIMLIEQIIGINYQNRWETFRESDLPRTFDAKIRLSKFVGVRYTNIFSFDAIHIKDSQRKRIQATMKTQFTIGNNVENRNGKTIVKIPRLAYKLITYSDEQKKRKISMTEDEKRKIRMTEDEEQSIKEIQKIQKTLSNIRDSKIINNIPLTDILYEKYYIENTEEYDGRVQALMFWTKDQIENKFYSYLYRIRHSSDENSDENSDEKIKQDLITGERMLLTRSNHISIELLNTIEYIFDTPYEKWYPGYKMVAEECCVELQNPDIKSKAVVSEKFKIWYDAGSNLYYFNTNSSKKFNFIGTTLTPENKFIFCNENDSIIRRANNIDSIRDEEETVLCAASQTKIYPNIIVVIDLRVLMEKEIEDGVITVYDQEMFDGITFEHLSKFTENGDQKFGIRSGNLMIYPQSDTMIDISKAGDDYYFRINIDGKFGFLNSSGNMLIKDGIKYSKAFNYSDGYAVVVDENEKYGYINENGEEIISPQYDMAFDFSEGLATVNKNNKTYIINKKGQAISTEYKHVFRFNEGYALFEEENDEGKTIYGYINTNCNIVVPAQFEFATSVKNGRVSVSQGNRIIQKEFKEVLQNDKVYYFSQI